MKIDNETLMNYCNLVSETLQAQQRYFANSRTSLGKSLLIKAKEYAKKLGAETHAIIHLIDEDPS